MARDQTIRLSRRIRPRAVPIRARPRHVLLPGVQSEGAHARERRTGAQRLSGQENKEGHMKTYALEIALVAVNFVIWTIVMLEVT